MFTKLLTFHIDIITSYTYTNRSREMTLATRQPLIINLNGEFFKCYKKFHIYQSLSRIVEN